MISSGFCDKLFTLSMEDERSFKNPFSDYSSPARFQGGRSQENEKAWQDKLLSVVHRLLKTLSGEFVPDSKDYTIYTGSAGQAFLHLHLYDKFSHGQDVSHLKQALSWLQPCLSKLKGSKISFLCGDAGPLALAAVVYHKLNDTKQCNYYIQKVENLWNPEADDPSLPDELLYGRCGYLSALFFLRQHIGRGSVQQHKISQVVDAILRSGQKLARKQNSALPLMYEWHDKVYLGAAHGFAGILYLLLQIDEPSMRLKIQPLVQPCIDHMLTLRFASGNCPSSLGSSSGDKLVQWCHGAPGWAFMFSEAYKVFKDKRYLQAAQDCADVTWTRGLLRKGYGICHGPSGNAYTFLTLFKLTGDQKYIYYANQFAEWCCDYGKHGCRIADRPYSMFEGMAGTIYFLVDMMDPARSAFPAFEFKS